MHKTFRTVNGKVGANALVTFILFALSMVLVVEGIIGIPFAGSRLSLLVGAFIYLFAAAAVGIFFATIARSMAQFGLLCMISELPIAMLSVVTDPIESQPG